jgi:hypothetical protein
MVKHVVMWRLYKNDRRNRLLIIDLLSGLPEVIENLESLETGENFNKGPFAYDLILITTHKDKAALERYRKHPEHVAVANRIKELTDERTVVDFEYQEDVKQN